MKSAFAVWLNLAPVEPGGVMAQEHRNSALKDKEANDFFTQVPRKRFWCQGSRTSFRAHAVSAWLRFGLSADCPTFIHHCPVLLYQFEARVGREIAGHQLENWHR